MTMRRQDAMTPWPRRAGLTLAELLVALMIGGLTLVITAQATTSVRLWGDRLTRAEKTNAKMTGLYQFAQQVLSQALPVPYKDEDGNAVTLFEGDASQIRFVRAEPGYPSRAGLYQYHLYVTGAEPAWALVLEREMLTSPAQFGAMHSPVRLVLYQGPHQPGFAYLGSGEWQKRWSEANTPPVLVRFDMHGWPGLSIALPRPRALLSGQGGKAPPDEAGPDSQQGDKNPAKASP